MSSRVYARVTFFALLTSVVMFVVAPATASPAPRSYANTLVHHVGDTKASWFVTSDLKRLRVPDAATYACLRKRGIPDRGALSSRVLLKLSDQVRENAGCGDRMTLEQQVPHGTLERELRRGMFLKSSDGRFELILQHDGNLVLYGPGGARWSNNRFDSVEAILQSDGNFVTRRADGTPNWSTKTRLLDEPIRGAIRRGLVVQNDGNLVLYGPTRALWSTGTAA